MCIKSDSVDLIFTSKMGEGIGMIKSLADLVSIVLMQMPRYIHKKQHFFIFGQWAVALHHISQETRQTLCQ